MINFAKHFSTSFIAILLTLTTPCLSQSNGFEVIRSLELLDQIYEHLEKYYVDDIEAGRLSKTAIDAVLKDLDPYTIYYHESNIEDYKLMTTGQYGGIGSLIRKYNNYVYISEPYKDKPAEKAGLKAGDKILVIDGKGMENKSSLDISKILKGPKGSEVEIKIERDIGERKTIKTFTVYRDEIKLPDVPYSGMLNETTGYIKLNSFTKTASSAVKSSFLQLKNEGMKELILDLRGNGGGLLIEAVRIVNMFVEKNQVVVSTKGRLKEENNIYKTIADPIDKEIPLIVLIDKRSASASEIVSGSLQDLDRALIIGEESFGKGLVQRTYNLKYGSKVKLTIAKYYTPSGRCVQRLDYYDKNNLEKVSEIADSLIKKFKTKNGRTVTDGRGIEPDIKLEPKILSPITKTLIKENFLFNYATSYYYKNDSIEKSSEFKLSETEYTDFLNYVLDQEFSYSTSSEMILKDVREELEKEGLFEDSKIEYNALMERIVPSIQNDLIKSKSEIKSILENEIISRYYYQSGRAQNSLKEDIVINKSIEVLKDIDNYNHILGN